jgi:hypothetical protein
VEIQRYQNGSEEMIEHKYESDLSELFCATFKGPACSNCPSSNRGEFCSELIAKYYQHIGLLSKEIRCHKFLPCDFIIEGGDIESCLQNCSLSPAVMINK